MNSEVYVVSSTNKLFLPYFGVMASSIVRQSGKNRSIRFLLLSSDITESDLGNYFGPADSRSLPIQLIDVSKKFAPFRNLKLEEGFPLEAVFRLAIPEVVPPHINRVLYLDCDLIALKDIAPLFDIDLGSNAIAAVQDIGIIGMSYENLSAEAERLRKLNIKEPMNYFSSGVMVWDLDAVKMRFDFQDAMEWISTNKPKFCDQDYLNYVFQGNTLLLNMKWNVLFDSNGIRVSEIASKAPRHLFQEYLEARNDPSIFHFAGPDKPWSQPVDGSKWFWECARSSDVYEYVVASLGSAKAKDFLKDTFGSIWNTFDNLYFQINEGERIRHDLHLRLTASEEALASCQRRLEITERSLKECAEEIDAIKNRTEELWQLKDILHRLIDKLRTKIHF